VIRLILSLLLLVFHIVFHFSCCLILNCAFILHVLDDLFATSLELCDERDNVLGSVNFCHVDYSKNAF